MIKITSSDELPEAVNTAINTKEVILLDESNQYTSSSERALVLAKQMEDWYKRDRSNKEKLFPRMTTKDYIESGQYSTWLKNMLNKLKNWKGAR